MKSSNLESRKDLQYVRNDRILLGQLLREYNDVASSQERNSEIMKALNALVDNPDYFNLDLMPTLTGEVKIPSKLSEKMGCSLNRKKFLLFHVQRRISKKLMLRI